MTKKEKKPLATPPKVKNMDKAFPKDKMKEQVKEKGKMKKGKC